MRMIGLFENQLQAKRFSAYLRSIDVENTCEISFDKVQEKVTASIWVHEEDAVQKAEEALTSFRKNPEDPQYLIDVPSSEQNFSAIENPNYQEEVKGSFTPFFSLTAFLVLLCILIFTMNTVEENVDFQKKQEDGEWMTTIENKLFYDLTGDVIAREKIFSTYGIDRNTPRSDLSLQTIRALEKASMEPYFQGFYFYGMRKLRGKEVFIPPMFVKISQGEVWRVFTPVILHHDFFHIFFNMLWLWLLGVQMERRLSCLRFGLFIFLTAAFSNTCQYLVTGPLFLGFSGVIAAMAAFIWMRQKVAPWEGYPISSATLYFLAFFVFSVLLVEMIASFLQVPSIGSHPSIASTAHITGGIFGAILGRFSFFSWSSN